jgi:hypothetical protein
MISTQPLAASKTGTQTVATAGVTVGWGKPNDNALKIATTTGSSSQVTIFGYEPGTAMPAPAPGSAAGASAVTWMVAPSSTPRTRTRVPPPTAGGSASASARRPPASRRRPYTFSDRSPKSTT